MRVVQVGGPLPGGNSNNTDLSEFIESGRLFRLDTMDELRALVRPRAAHLEAWLSSPNEPPPPDERTFRGNRSAWIRAAAGYATFMTKGLREGRACLAVLRDAHVL